MRRNDLEQEDELNNRLERQLRDAREQVESLDAAAVTMSSQLSQAEARLKEIDKPTYTGLGARIEQLLRSAEEKSAAIVSQDHAQAEDIPSLAQAQADQLTEQAESEAAVRLSTARS